MVRWLSFSLCALAACTTEPECETHADCDDGDVCTEDRCRLETCSNLTITFCCHDQRPCTDPLAPICNMDATPDAGRCVECIEDTDCTDTPFEACDTATNPHRCVICVDHADCAPGDVCIGNPRECLPPPPGGPCLRNEDCPSDWCLLEADTGFPGGFCGRSCVGPQDCLTGACIDVPGGKTCLGPCMPDCRPEYLCVPTDTGGACAPHCTGAAHCPAVNACDPWSGMCTSAPPLGAPNGAPCTSDADCHGFCVIEASGAPGGVCASGCSDSRRTCPDADACMYFLGPWIEQATLCQPVFNWESGCRPAYAPQIAAVLPTDTPDWGGAPVCQPACQDADCLSGVCNEYSGVCNAEPNPNGRDYGAPCQTNADCKGMCMFLWHEGYCMGPCILGGPACQDDAVCMNLGVLTSCGTFCDDDSDCREPEYHCDPTLQACVPTPDPP